MDGKGSWMLRMRTRPHVVVAVCCLLVMCWLPGHLRAEETAQETGQEAGTVSEGAFVLDDEAVRFGQDYEDQLPGEWPQGWKRLWGDSTEDILTLSNMKSVTGNQSLIFDRLSQKMFGLSCELPRLAPGTAAELSWFFLIEGAGYNASFSFEIRQGNQRDHPLGHVSFGSRNISLFPAKRGRKSKESMGKYAEGVWHRVVLSFPADTTEPLRGQVYAQQPSGEWALTGSGEVEAAEPRNVPIFFSLTPPPNFTGYSLYLDALRWREP